MQRGRKIGVPWVHHTPEDWQVRVFMPSGIIDTPSDRMYVWTIPMSGCMDRLYCYIVLKTNSTNSN